jgi:hypothetical protein
MPTPSKELDEFGPQVGILLYVEAERKKLSERLKELEGMEEQALEVIQEQLGRNEEGTYKGRPVVSWKITKSRRFNRKRFDVDYPELVEEYKDESESRSFKILLPEDK